MGTDDATTEPPRRTLGFTPLMERTIRFVVGIALLIREVLVYDDPREWVLILCITLSGTSLTAVADEIRREAAKFGNGNKDDG